MRQPIQQLLALSLCVFLLPWGGCNDSGSTEDSPPPSPTPTMTPGPIDDQDGDGYTVEDGDCDDTRADSSPAGTEIPYDGVDQDCSGADLTDRDQDGHAGGNLGDDCDDLQPQVYPGADEVPYDGVDQDCQGGDLDDMDGDGVLGGEGPDCDDTDAAIRPGAAEVPYDGIDQDCSGSDLIDIDRDGYAAIQAGGEDCDDLDYNVHPDAIEFGDGKDNNCNDVIDEALDTEDDDGDGYSEAQGDCNDGDSSINPGADEIVYDGIDQDCLAGDRVDVDGDGVASSEVEGGTDCQDDDASISPEADELCDGIDNDCDALVDEQPVDGSTWYTDSDGDGWGAASGSLSACEQSAGTVSSSGDCDDGRVSVYPGAPESCDGLDNDCDLQADEGVTSTWYLDADGDGHGQSSRPLEACSAPEGTVSNSTDCNDARQDIHPGAPEQCNGLDDDCDQSVDEDLALTPYYLDQDGDGFGGTQSQMTCSGPAEGYVTADKDCDDSSASIHPGAAERCNGTDDNCNGSVDEGVQHSYYPDFDGDGFGDPAQPVMACAAPAGYVDNGADCKDNSGSIYPGATEVCNGTDDDCDVQADEDVKTRYYQDYDKDGYGNASVSYDACTAPPGYVTDNTDCDDANAASHPGATELPNGIDDNCNSSVDDGAIFSSCRTLHTAQPLLPSGYYFIDPDGTGAALSPFEVYCDMSIDGGGWTRFWWVRGDYGAATVDPLGQALQNCDPRGTRCFARIPSVVSPSDFMVKDVKESHYALWNFDANNLISNAVLGAFRDHATSCISGSSSFWNPYYHNDASGEAWCGNGGEGGRCDSFFYQFNASCTTYRSGAGYSIELDGDNGCYAAAFKMGVGQDGYPECASPDNNFLDDGPTSSDDDHGELYYR